MVQISQSADPAAIFMSSGPQALIHISIVDKNFRSVADIGYKCIAKGTEHLRKSYKGHCTMVLRYNGTEKQLRTTEVAISQGLCGDQPRISCCNGGVPRGGYVKTYLV